MTRPETNLLRAMNAARAAYGFRPLHVDATLERAARAHSSEMIHADAFVHGDTFGRLRTFGARGPALGENLAWGSGRYAAASAVVQEWLTSPGHRANLLRPGFRRVGIGAVAGRFQGAGRAIVVTADFGGR